MKKAHGKPRLASTSEADRRCTTHRTLRDHVRKGWPGAAEELRAFRAGWAAEFYVRQQAAGSMEAEEYWERLYERWANLAQREGI